VQVARDGRWTPLPCKDILVGDLVLLSDDDEIPADLVLVASSEEDGMCHIQTSNLDGESDLKPRHAAARLSEPRADGDGAGGSSSAADGDGPAIPRPATPAAVLASRVARLEIACPPPSAEVYRFDASVTVPGASAPAPLSHENLLPQATHLRNAAWAAGVAVYTGNETKIGMNKRDVPTKWTRLDGTINRATFGIFALQLVLVITLGVIGNVWKAHKGEKLPYLEYPLDEAWYAPAIIPLRFLLLCSVMIPISLKVSMDIVKYAYALFIGWDEKMCYLPEEQRPRSDPETGAPQPPAEETPEHGGYAVANSTSLAEDLGSIRHIMTDKTGTLTENVMRLHSLASRGRLYSPPSPGGDDGDSNDNNIDDNGDGDINNGSGGGGNGGSSKRKSGGGGGGGGTGLGVDPMLREAVESGDEGVCALLRCLAVCNNVMVARGAGHAYRASSPDEEALVVACAELGFPLRARDGARVAIGDPHVKGEVQCVLFFLFFFIFFYFIFHHP
jgi:phospholipid-translocating ATPase